jgi:two-component system, LytTR family, response regulator
MEEISSRLWENEVYDSSKLRQIHTFFSSMNETLNSVEACDVIIKQYRSIAVNVKKIDCDYFDFLAGGPRALEQLFNGEYMTN